MDEIFVFENNNGFLIQIMIECDLNRQANFYFSLDLNHSLTRFESLPFNVNLNQMTIFILYISVLSLSYIETFSLSNFLQIIQ